MSIIAHAYAPSPVRYRDVHIVEVDLPVPEVAIFDIDQTGLVLAVDRRVTPERLDRALAAARVLATLDK